jgi:hypothetical protein
MEQNNYFSKAKKAARNVIQDTSAAHSAAIKVLEQMKPNMPAEFYGDMGWQAVMAAREGLVFRNSK